MVTSATGQNGGEVEGRKQDVRWRTGRGAVNHVNHPSVPERQTSRESFLRGAESRAVGCVTDGGCGVGRFSPAGSAAPFEPTSNPRERMARWRAARRTGRSGNRLVGSRGAVDEDGRPTPDANPAVGFAVYEAHDQVIGGRKIRHDEQRFPVCADHARMINSLKHWRFQEWPSRQMLEDAERELKHAQEK